MKLKLKFSFFIFLLIASSLNIPDTADAEANKSEENKFVLGNENLILKNSGYLENKNIALVTNKSGVTSDGTLFLDVLNKKFSVNKIFTPEHGLRTDDNNDDFTDSETGIRVISLYGNKKKPSQIDLEGTDVIVYDLQDAGARFYTFINTMYYCMESAAENNKKFIVCDRPVIPYGNYTDGFLLDQDITSFVGMINVPAAYGMTCGELAGYLNSEYFDGKCNLFVSEMDNYNHETEYLSLNLPWIKPSPNMYYPSSAVCYLGTCLFEGTNFSEGRGTERPFEFVGAPYCDGELLSNEMKSYNLSGVRFESISFTPETVTSPSNPPKYVGESCGGVFINVTDKKSFEPLKAAVALLISLNKLFPEFEFKKNNFIDKLAGTKNLRLMIVNGRSLNEITESYAGSLEEFRIKRKKYLLYN
ncbi:MAG: DUF1343 domain-containing protein [Ignavibacteria bacterium]|nr:DUF1343 domain-containing protein [Ignavibacteria bacterium]